MTRDPAATGWLALSVVQRRRRAIGLAAYMTVLSGVGAAIFVAVGEPWVILPSVGALWPMQMAMLWLYSTRPADGRRLVMRFVLPGWAVLFTAGMAMAVAMSE